MEPWGIGTPAGEGRVRCLCWNEWSSAGDAGRNVTRVSMSLLDLSYSADALLGLCLRSLRVSRRRSALLSTLPGNVTRHAKAMVLCCLRSARFLRDYKRVERLEAWARNHSL